MTAAEWNGAPVPGLVFTYGTLMQGGSNHGLLRGSRFVGSATTIGRFRMTRTRHIPFVHDDREEVRIRGEVFQVDAATMALLDELEGHPRWYERQVILVEDDHGWVCSAWCYFNARDEGEVEVPSGDFRMPHNVERR